MTARREGETLQEMTARLRNGQWNPIDARAGTAMLPYTRWGTKRPRTVWRGQVSRFVDGKFQFERCCSTNHTVRAKAEECAARTARWLNKHPEEEQS